MTLPQQYFRAGVGALIVHRDGHVLALERADHPGAWQLPQGGLDRSEEPLDSVYREIGEETGLGSSALREDRPRPGALLVSLPPNRRRRSD